MTMYHQPSKRREIFTRILVYSLMTVTVITIVAIALLYMLGYRFDSGYVEQSGLVQFVSKPSKAQVAVDGQLLSSTTPSKTTVLPGAHEFTMQRDGYNAWHKTVTITAGTLTWLNYARLIPQKLESEIVASLPHVSGGLAAPDRDHYAVIQDSSKPVIGLYDLTRDDVTDRNVTIPTVDYQAAVKKTDQHDFKLVRWDKDGRYLLVRHTVGTQDEWIVVDTDSAAQAVDVTKELDVPIKAVDFASSNGSSFFALINNDVRKINLSDGTISSPLVTDVSEFSVFSDDVISYITLPDSKTGLRSAGIVKDGQTPVVLATNDQPKTAFHIVAGHYFHDDVVAISNNSDTTIYQGQFPNKQTEADKLSVSATLPLSDDVEWLQLSGESRFVVAQHGATFRSYDLETNATSDKVTLDGTTTPDKLHWLDDYMVWSDRSSQLSVREFDGANKHTIGTIATGFDVTLSPNGKYLYSIGKTKTGFALQRVLLILG